MTTSGQEISEDYDHDNNPVFEEAFGDDIDTLNSDVKELSSLDAELKQLIDAAIAIENHGINPSAFGVMKATGLLAGTSLDALAMESFGVKDSSDLESEMALEALTDKIKAKAADWSAKILSFAKKMSTMVLDTISTVWTKILDQGKKLTQGAWNAAGSAKATIKAHPFKTVAACVAATTVVVSIVALVASGMPGAYANESALQSFIYRVEDMIKKIKWPFGKISTGVVEHGTKITYQLEHAESAAKASGTASELGWSPSAIRSITGSLSRAWSGLKAGVGQAAEKVVSVGKKINQIEDPGVAAKQFVAKKTGSKISGWVSQQIANKIYTTALWAVIGVLYCLLKDIALKTYKVVSETFRGIEPATQPA